MKEVRMLKVCEIFENNQPCRYWGIFETIRDVWGYYQGNNMVYGKFTVLQDALDAMSKITSSNNEN